jgi:leader peptidase (prepilin peptidase)/N-methyltransferase
MDAFIEVNTQFPWFFQMMAFVFGAIVGSFLNVCIYRIPTERSIVKPGSTCACGKPIAWYDNLPIFSWIILRGRARCCGGKFSVRYPAIEALTGALFLFCWLQHPPARAAAGMVFVSLLICATFIDFDHMIIPDRFSIGAAVIGVIISIAVPELHGRSHDFYFVEMVQSMVDSMVGVLIGSGLVLWIALLAEVVLKKEAMGFGDVKLVGAIGAFCGWQGAVFSVFGGAMLGTFGFIIMMIFNAMVKGRSLPKDGESSELMGREIPFGPMLAAGAVLYFLWLHTWVDKYFSDVSELLMAGS